MEERTITVNGQSKLAVPPDSIVINMSLTTLKENYNAAIEEAGEGLNELRKCLNTVGFTKDEIKTTDFQVTTKYENLKDDEGNSKRIFKGYEVINKLRVEFPEDTIRLAKILNTISSCKAKPEFNISYEVKDKKQFEERLLAGAIEDAQVKAQIMAGAAKVRLSKILKIEGGQVFIANGNSGFKLAMESDFTLDLEPDNIKGEALVTMIWRIDG